MNNAFRRPNSITSNGECGEYNLKLAKLRYMSDLLSELSAMSKDVRQPTLAYLVEMAALESMQQIELLRSQDVFAEEPL